MIRLLLLNFMLTLCFDSFCQTYREIGEINDMKLVEANGNIGVMDYNENIIVSPDSYTKIIYDSENLIYRCFKGQKTFEIVTEQNKKIQSDLLFVDILENDNNGLIKVKSKFGEGYLKNDKVLISPIYDKIKLEYETYHSAYLNFILYKDKKKGLFINDEEVLETEYDDFQKINTYTNSNILLISKKKLKGLMNLGNYDLKKELIMPVEFQEIIQLEELDEDVIFKVKKENLWGLFSLKSKNYTVATEFESIDWKNKVEFENCYLLKVKKNKDSKFLIVDPNSNKTSNLFDEIKELDDEYLAVRLNKKWGLLETKNFNLVIDCQYDNFDDLNNKYLEDN